MDRNAVVDKLNDILRWEWTGVSQYAHYSYMIRGVWREVYSSMFREDAEECFRHANTIADKIVALDGVPTIERDKVHKTDDLTEMLEQSLKFEQQAVQMYSEALDIVDDDPPLRVLLEDLVLEEQQGADHLYKLLKDHTVAAKKQKPTSKSA